MANSYPSIIVIFGITGDLAQRKLLPALYHLFKDDLLHEKTVILGITRREVAADELLSNVELCVNEIEMVCDPGALGKVHRSLRMHKMSQTDPDEYRELSSLLEKIEAEQGTCMNRLFYLAIPPQMFEPIVRNLGELKLNGSCSHGTAHSRLLIEKPFGYDLTSAKQLIEETGEWFDEEQIFRIDHYLAKDTVQNIISFRKSDPLIEELWNSQHIETIAISAFETIDIEGRSTFYEEIGALRDFIQSHLLQLLAITAMDLPRSMTSEDVHRSRLTLLSSIDQIVPSDVLSKTKRAQYEGYRQEVDNLDSIVETFAQVELAIATPRWEGTRVILQTGKAMKEKYTEVALSLKDSGTILFRIQPNAQILVNPAGSSQKIAHSLLQLAETFNGLHPAPPTAHPDAYERVLIDAVRGDHTLFTTSEEVIAAWKVMTHVVSEWSKTAEGLTSYPKGSDIRDIVPN